ncbi:putative transporter [Toxoplasma gondii VAND]|uniref:Putative transporter n=2 Tax=Toxoplasma gondii TaxID=5811 RepID=A0A086QHX1_TOXGO|nr:putative transporter [Toxoplasma gondii VAND]
MERTCTTDLSTSGSKVEERNPQRGRGGVRVAPALSRRLTVDEYLDLFHRERRVSSALEYFPTAPVRESEICRVEDVPPELTLKVAAELARQNSRLSANYLDASGGGGEVTPQDEEQEDAGIPEGQVEKATEDPKLGFSGLCERLRNKFFPRAHTTSAMMAARLQPTPCGVNRFILLGIYLIYSLLTGRVFFAWPSISNMLFRDGAYLWNCGDLDDPAAVDHRLEENGGKRFACEDQNTAVQNLFVVCLACAFACALLAGLLLDKLGPKLTGMFGQTCNFTAWVLLGFAGEGVPTYYPAFVLMGVGADSGYMASLSIANLFPGHEALVVALLGSAKSLSYAMPAILDTLDANSSVISVKDVCLGYAVLGPGLCWLICLVLIGFHPFLPWASFVHIEEAVEQLARRQSGRQWSQVFRSSSVSTIFKMKRGKISGSREEDGDSSRPQIESVNRRTSSVTVHSSGPSAPAADPAPSLRRQLMSPYCILMVVHTVIQSILYPFLSTSAENLYGKDVNNFLGICLPFGCVACIIYGKLTDMYGITKVLIGLNTIITVVFVLTLIHTVATSYIAAVLIIVYVGFYSSQVYCFVSDTFAAAQFGRIVGTIFIVGGFSSLLKIPLQSMVVEVFHSVYTWPVIMMIGLCCFNYGILGVLLYFKRKNPHPFWPADAAAAVDERVEKTSSGKQGGRSGELVIKAGSETELGVPTTVTPSSDLGGRAEPDAEDVCVAIDRS